MIKLLYYLCYICPVGMEKAEMKRIATSIKIDPNLWKETKIAAINFDTTVSELVETAIKDYIKKRRE